MINIGQNLAKISMCQVMCFLYALCHLILKTILIGGKYFNLCIYRKRKHDVVSSVTCSYSCLLVIILVFHPDMSQCKAHAPNQWPSCHLIFPGDPCIAQRDSWVFTSDIILEKWVKVFSLKNVFNVVMFLDMKSKCI